MMAGPQSLERGKENGTRTRNATETVVETEGTATVVTRTGTVIATGSTAIEAKEGNTAIVNVLMTVIDAGAMILKGTGYFSVCYGYAMIPLPFVCFMPRFIVGI